MSEERPHHVEYQTRAGYQTVIADDGMQFAAFGAQPLLGQRFPAIVLLHDWWGLTASVRALAVQLAQAGYYVIAPDLFDGHTADTAREAASLVELIARKKRFARVLDAFEVVEQHQHTKHQVAVVGVGLGGSLAFRAAIQYPHREKAAIAFSGFPQTYMGKFRHCPVPVLAVYGSDDHLIPKTMVDVLRTELAAADRHDAHRVVVIPGAGHDLFPDDADGDDRETSARALAHALTFLEHHVRNVPA